MLVGTLYTWDLNENNKNDENTKRWKLKSPPPSGRGLIKSCQNKIPRSFSSFLPLCRHFYHIICHFHHYSSCCWHISFILLDWREMIKVSKTSDVSDLKKSLKTFCNLHENSTSSNAFQKIVIFCQHPWSNESKSFACKCFTRIHI